MTVEYDIIVIGGSTAGIYAAVAATQLKARVALIQNERVQTNGLGQGAIIAQALNQVGRVREQLREATQLGFFSRFEATEPPQVPPVQIQETMQWAQIVAETCREQNSPAVLASLGVDLITGAGEFCQRPHLGFVVNNRQMRSRAYLIATGSRPVVPEIEGLQTIGYLTPSDILQPNFAQRLQGNWVVIGNSAISVELAQTLARLNCKVTLIASTSLVLPNEDIEASHLVQAQLEAEGICVLTESPVTHVRQIEDKKWVQAGSRAVEADEILIATAQQLNVESLNLEGVGVKFTPQGLKLNEKLQTTNPRIYVCGDVTNGYQFAHIAQYEASVALKNALFAPIFKADYRSIPWAVFCDPQLAGVGLTEAQARQRYGKDVLVVRQYFKTLERAQILGSTTGFCKLVGRENGEILGASMVGASASELIGAIAFAIQQKIKVDKLANLPQVSPTLSEILHKTAIEWQQQRRSRNKTLQNFLEEFFNLRRKWSS